MGVPLDGMSKMSRGSPEAPIDRASLRGVSGYADRLGRGEAGTILLWNIVISTLIYAHEAMCFQGHSWPLGLDSMRKLTKQSIEHIVL